MRHKRSALERIMRMALEENLRKPAVNTSPATGLRHPVEAKLIRETILSNFLILDV